MGGGLVCFAGASSGIQDLGRIQRQAIGNFFISRGFPDGFQQPCNLHDDTAIWACVNIIALVKAPHIINAFNILSGPPKPTYVLVDFWAYDFGMMLGSLRQGLRLQG